MNPTRTFAVLLAVVGLGCGGVAFTTGQATRAAATDRPLTTPLWSPRRVPQPVVDAVGSQRLQASPRPGGRLDERRLLRGGRRRRAGRDPRRRRRSDPGVDPEDPHDDRGVVGAGSRRPPRHAGGRRQGRRGRHARQALPGGWGRPAAGDAGVPGDPRGRSDHARQQVDCAVGSRRRDRQGRDQAHHRRHRRRRQPLRDRALSPDLEGLVPHRRPGRPDRCADRRPRVQRDQAPSDLGRRSGGVRGSAAPASPGGPGGDGERRRVTGQGARRRGRDRQDPVGADQGRDR